MHATRLSVAVLTAVALSASAQSLQAPKLFTPATEQRARALLAQMTPEEKVGQMTQLFVFGKSVQIDAQAGSGGDTLSADDRARSGRLGSALFMTDPAAINRLQHLAVDDSRLHIPLLFGFDVIHGFRTIFPVPLAMASAWDADNTILAQTVAAKEARSVGIGWAFAPMVDIAPDARWGRIVEGAGEDPYLGAAAARAQVIGFQGPAIGAADHVVACVKHFAGYGAAEGGRDYDASYISEAELHNKYLVPFRAAVQAGAGSLMSAYMDLNDVPATGNKFLLHDTLHEEWGFNGFVVSDANAVKSLVPHGFAEDPADAALRAFDAGLNMEMALNKPAFDTLVGALKSGRISAAEVDARVLPILETKIQLGLFEHPYADVARSEQVLADPAHRSVAAKVAERTMVLLKNDAGTLPLKASAVKHIAVLGPTGNDPRDLTGSWTFVQNDAETVTIPSALRARLGASATVDVAAGVQISRFFPSFFNAITGETEEVKWSAAEAEAQFNKALDLARSADVVLLTLGEHRMMAGEAASRSTIDLPGEQMKLLRAVAALHKPTVLVLQNGRPLDITEALPLVPAVLETWEPGTRGGEAIVATLFGDNNPGGHLTTAWPRSIGQIPTPYAHNLTQDTAKQGERYWNEPSTPLFPFGYGLSYTTFAFSNLKLDGASSKIGQPVQVSVTVQNTGSVAGDAVAQIYIHQQHGRASRPVRQLKGFERVTLKPHETRTLHFTLGHDELQYWSAAEKAWIEDATTFDLYAGDSSAATLHTEFTRIQ